MRKIFFLSLPILIISIGASAQRGYRSKYEWVYGIGITGFLGELGGANATGTHFVRDFEYKTSRPVISVGLRRRLSSFTSVKSNFFYGYISGSDRLTTEYFRQNRNLSFRSPIIELSAQFEFFIIKEQQGALYKIKNARGKKHIDILLYGFAGSGVFFFNPQAKYAGTWVKLQPLGTEGQGLVPGTRKYFRLSPAILYGGGMKFGISRKLSAGVEIGLRKTFTDYLDDVSTTYYDNDALRLIRGDIAAELADPSFDKGPSSPNADGSGAQRGNPENKDFYGFVSFTVNYKMLYRRKTRSKF